jgi:hypothetical protein
MCRVNSVRSSSLIVCVTLEDDPWTEMFDKCKDGLVLAKLINDSVPDTIDERVLNKAGKKIARTKPSLHLSNISNVSVGKGRRSPTSASPARTALMFSACVQRQCGWTNPCPGIIFQCHAYDQRRRTNRVSLHLSNISNVSVGKGRRSPTSASPARTALMCRVRWHWGISACVQRQCGWTNPCPGIIFQCHAYDQRSASAGPLNHGRGGSWCTGTFGGC